MTITLFPAGYEIAIIAELYGRDCGVPGLLSSYVI